MKQTPITPMKPALVTLVQKTKEVRSIWLYGDMGWMKYINFYESILEPEISVMSYP